MKKLFTLLYIIIAFSAKADYWTQKADFRELEETSCISFSIGNKGYIGLGSDMDQHYYNDFWEYDPFTNAWTQKANFPELSKIGCCWFFN